MENQFPWASLAFLRRRCRFHPTWQPGHSSCRHTARAVGRHSSPAPFGRPHHLKCRLSPLSGRGPAVPRSRPPPGCGVWSPRSWQQRALIIVTRLVAGLIPTAALVSVFWARSSLRLLGVGEKCCLGCHVKNKPHPTSYCVSDISGAAFGRHPVTSKRVFNTIITT